MKERLDKLIVERNILETREKAKAFILGGNITVDGQTVTKPSSMIDEGADIQLRIPNRGYVSRGGVKLEGALKDFRLDISGAFCLDIGASTGGFTDCLLNHGAREVVALDVGKNQIDYRLRKDPRVVVIEKFNARFIDGLRLTTVPDVVTVDVSFISLRLILPPLKRIIDNETEVIALIKPQFELEKPSASFRGVVRDAAIHIGILKELDTFFFTNGYGVWGYTFSRIRGPRGNMEFFVHLRKTTVLTLDKRRDTIEVVVTQAHRYFSGNTFLS